MATQPTNSPTTTQMFVAELPIRYPEFNGSIVGPGGSGLRELREQSEHSFQIKLVNSKEPTNYRPNFIDCDTFKVQSFSEEGIQEAVRLLKLKIQSLREKKKRNDSLFRDTLPIKKGDMGKLIGRNGETIRGIKKEMEDKVDGWVNFSVRDEQVFMTSSTKELLDISKKHIEEKISSFSENIVEFNSKVVPVKPGDVGRILGRGGENIKGIIAKLPGKAHITYQSEVGGFTIKAQNDEVLEMATKLIHEASQQKMPTWAQQQQKFVQVTESLFWDSDEE